MSDKNTRDGVLYPVAALLGRLPSNIHAPEILLEEDGDLALDWNYASDCSVTVSLAPSGRVAWAALIGSCSGSGKFMLPEWPSEFADMLTRLAGRTR